MSLNIRVHGWKAPGINDTSGIGIFRYRIGVGIAIGICEGMYINHRSVRLAGASFALRVPA